MDLSAPRERREHRRSKPGMPEDLRRRVFGSLLYTATPLAPIASYLLWRQYLVVGNLSSLWMASAYGLLSALLIGSFLALRARRLDWAVRLFAYPAALLLSFQIFVSPSVLISVTVTEMLLLGSICFVVMEAEAFKLYAVVQAACALAFGLARSQLMPAPLAFPAWEIFSRQVVPLAIFLVFQVAILFMTVKLRSLLAENSAVLASLKDQREQLDRKNDDLRLFFSAASHDLRQPLRQVLGFARLLEKRHEQSFSAEAKEYLGFIEQVTGRMEGLLDALLRYSSLGAQAIETAPVDLNEALKRSAQAVLGDLPPPGVEIEAGDLPTVPGQADLLGDVFRELLNNCVKYRHPERPLKIAVRAEVVEGGWLLTLDDNGIGIPQGVRPGLFKVFHRGHPPAHYPGYGIGLAYCKRVLELHGGWIRSVEKEEPGARFEWFLPQAAAGDASSFSSH